MIKTRYRHIKGRKVQYLDQHGFWKSTGCDSLAEAKLWYERNIEGNANGNFRNFSQDMFTDRRVGSYWWVRQNTNRGATEAWWYCNNIILQNYILPAFGDLEMRDITPSLVQDWYFSLKGKRKGYVGDSTKNIYMRCLKQVFDWARLKGIIASNPVDGVIKIIAQNKRRDRFSDEELAMMFPESIGEAISVWNDMALASFLYIMKDTGWRPGEILGLSVEGFYPEYRGIFTSQSFDSFTKEIKPTIKTSRKGYDHKVGILSPFTVSLFEAYLKDSGIHEGAVFKKSGMDTHSIRLLYIDRMNKLGISTENRPPYAIRTTFMTRMARKYDEETVKELMGHTQWHDCYDRRTPEELLAKIASRIS